MRPFALRLFSSLLSLVIPRRKTEEVVSALSLETLRSLSLPGIYDALLPYHEPRVKSLVWELKFYRNTRALEFAAALLSERVAEIIAEELSPVLLIPIPMHKKRRNARGYNHTEDLCREIARRTGCATLPLLIKQKETPRQVEVPAAARRSNLIGTYGVSDATAIASRTCVIIDDVTTTGATFEEARRALTQAGALRIVPLALARS